MATVLQPLSQSEQLVTDLIKKLRHAFRQEATDQLVSQNEFMNAFNRVFTGVSTEKFRQIFINFDEEHNNTINWYRFLKEQELPKVLLALHDQSLSQITMLQQNSSFSDQTIQTTDAENAENDDRMTMPIFPTPHNTNTTQSSSHSGPHSFDITKHSSAEIRQSLTSPHMSPHISIEESINSLKHDVIERDAEIVKLKNWIAMKGLPLQQSVSTLKDNISKAKIREQQYKDEVKTFQDKSDSLKAQNIALQKDNTEIQTQYIALQNEHKSFKNLCNEIQRKYDECLELYNKQKDETNHFNTQISDLTKLKNQYDIVNEDQNNKIKQLKKERDDFREKAGLLEMYVQDIIAENEQLNQYINSHVAPSGNQTPTTDAKEASRIRSLSAVREDTESQTPVMLPIDTNVEMIDVQHPLQRSTSFKIHTFEQLTRRYSNVVTTPGAKRGSILERIRSQVASPPDESKSDNPFHNAYDSGMVPRLTDHDSSTSTISSSGTGSFYANMYGGRRRKKTVSIISLNSIIPQHRKINTGVGLGLNPYDSMGLSMQSGIGDNDSGFADQAYAEWGMDNDDDVDQLQELTEQLRLELQEEMEEELEDKIASKYDLKILKLRSEHNEQILELNREIDKLRMMNSGGKGYENMMGMDDQKTSEKGYDKASIHRMKMGDDMDDFNSNSNEYDDDDMSESSYDDDGDDMLEMDVVDSDEDEQFLDEDDTDDESKDNYNYIVVNENGNGAYGGDKINNNTVYDQYENTTPLLSGEDKGSSKKNKKKKKRKDKGKGKDKKGRKRERYMGKKREKEIKKDRFCCSSIFADVGEKEINISSRESSPMKSPKSSKKKRKDKDGRKKRKKDKDRGKRGRKDKDKKERRSKKDKDKKRSKSKGKSKKKKHKKDKDRNKKYIE